MMAEVFGGFSERNFRLLWLAQATSTLGDRIVFVALALYVDEIGSPTDVGLVLGAHTLPLVAFVLLGGVWADRLPRHRVMLATDLVRGALHALLAALIFTGSIEIWQIVVIEALFGTAEAFFRPAYTGLVPQTVPETRLQDANAVRAFTENAAEFVGPAIAAALVLGLGAGPAFAIDAATFLVSAAFLARVRPRPRGEVPAREPVLAELRAGWGAVRERAWVWAVIVSASLVLLLSVAPLYTLGPSVAGDVYDDRGLYGLVLAAYGGGTLLGAIVSVRLRPRRPILAANLAALGWPVAVVAFAVETPVPAVVALWALAGIGIALFLVWWETALAQRIPPHLLSRVSAFDWMGSLALLPLGYLLAGPLGEAFGGVEVLVAGGALGVLATLAVLLVPDVWRLERLAKPPEVPPAPGVAAAGARK